MLLYRAQNIPTGRRIREPLGNEPENRIAGRWFTDDLESAYQHLSSLTGPSQIICVEITDNVAESYRVSNMPHTPCGLSPVLHSASPENDFVIPRFFASKAEEVETVADDETGEIVSIDFSSQGRQEIGRVTSILGDTVLYREPSGHYPYTLVSHQTDSSISFNAASAEAVGAMLLEQAEADQRKVA